MKIAIRLRFGIQFVSTLFMLMVLFFGCYRKDLDDYADTNTVFFYTIVNGVRYSYENPLNPITYKEGKSQGLLAAVYNNLEYPEQAKLNGIEGRVDIQFRIKENGKVDEIIILADIGDGCGEAAVKAVRNATDGQPFEPTGLSSDLYGALYIQFKL